MYRVKRGDTHDIVFTVKNAARQTVDLSGSSVRILGRRKGDRTLEVFELDAELGADPGTVIHTLTGTLDVGVYRLEVEITEGAVITTAPADGWVELQVTSDLG
jgi:archaellum component FlaG (FlaF/FlaG flagellin family)